MKKLLSYAVAAALVTTAAFIDPVVPHAQQSAQAPTPYQKLADALANDAMMDLNFRVLIDGAMTKQFMADENIAGLEIVCPGTITALMTAIEPPMYQLQVRGYSLYRQDLAALFAAELTQEDAALAAEFYNSDLGQKFVTSIVKSSTLDRSLASAMANEDSSVDNDALVTDVRTSVIRGMVAMSPAERAEITQILTTAPWMASYRTLEPNIQALQLRLANTDFENDEEEQFTRLIETAVENHIESCGLPE